MCFVYNYTHYQTISVKNSKKKVKSSFEFAKEIADQGPGLFMASLDVESLFTNIPLEETTSAL